MRLFQTIAQIMIATSVVNCAPVQGVPVPGWPDIYLSQLPDIWPTDYPKNGDLGKSHRVPGGGIGVDSKLSLDSPHGTLAEPADRTDKTVRPAVNIVPPSGYSHNTAQPVDKTARPSGNTAQPVDNTARPATAGEPLGPLNPIDDPSTSTENKIKIDNSKTATTAAAAVAFVAGVTGIVTGIGSTKNHNSTSSPPSN